MKDEDFIKKLAKRIQTLREKKGVDKKQFAFEIGIARMQLTVIEQGKVAPNLRTLLKIANGLDITLSELVDV